ncbi:hypothetical protein MG290_11340 [Flavobacterium sp. CBA20B-1]|uniref:hypothetical protein n=1 Tax=unclassified Flavobacterium TaxID=196869 RepID=UPI0022255136|nr:MULTISPECIES: hypothetical protein [unclassified Flavobacterium]WCM41538.1 hypothetical protein MG290_11340 [Flavobacterium sp. CBA20B-1]
MKKLKFYTLVIVGAVLATTGLYSCNQDSDELENTPITSESNLIKRVGDPIEQINELANEFNLNAEIVDNVNPDEAVAVFSSFEEYREFIRNLQEEHSKEVSIDVKPQTPPLTSFGCADGIYSGAFGGFGGATLQFDLVIKDGSISSVTGYLTGFALGYSFTQGVVSIDAGGATVTGTKNYVLFYEGIATIWSIPVRYRLNLPC